MKTAVLCEGKTLPEIFTLTSVCGIGQTLLPFKSRKIKRIKDRKAERKRMHFSVTGETAVLVA